ncbi:MAG: hypothetical protein Mars2KO_03460 [Maribacter sp.]|uniref:hypothetical protein n=1 Tax=Maribacter sp. 2307UL18-2 TaxID=3386274 RepID=UPI0039BD04A4
MGVFDSLNQTSHKAVEIGEQYIQKSQEYYKLKVFQQLTTIIGMFCKIAIVGSLALIGLTLVLVAGILALGNFLGNMVHACLIVAAVIFLVSTLVYKLRTKIDTLIIKKTAKQYFD